LAALTPCRTNAEHAEHPCVYNYLLRDNFWKGNGQRVDSRSHENYEIRKLNQYKIRNTANTTATTIDGHTVAIMQIPPFHQLSLGGALLLLLQLGNPLFPFLSSTRHLSCLVFLVHCGHALYSRLGTRTTLVSTSTEPPTIVSIPVI